MADRNPQDVKAIIETSGCPTSTGPSSSPIPGTSCRTSGGTPASCRISTNCTAITDDRSAGFITTVVPVTSAAVVIPAGIASGKFHGAMTETTPRGR